MYVYLIGVLLSLMLSFIGCKMKNKKHALVFKFLSILPFFLISAFRYNVGTDYDFRYVSSFYYLKMGKSIPNLELGYKLLNKLILLFTSNFIWIFIITSFLIIFPIFYTFFKKSKNPILSIALFFLGGFFFQSLNMLRQYISIAIVFLSVDDLYNKKYKRFILSIVIAYFFHSISIIYLILIFIKNKIILSPKIVMPISILVIIFKNYLLKLLYIIFSFTKYKVYFDSKYNVSQLKVSLFVFNVIIYLILYYLYKQKKKENNLQKEDTLYVNIQGIGVLLCVFGIVMSLSFRAAILFFIFQCLSIPSMLDISNTKIKQSLCIVILATSCLYIYHTNIKNNDNGVLPYCSIFNCEVVNNYE